MKMKKENFDKETMGAVKELLKRIPEEKLSKAVGGLTNRQLKVLFGVGGALAAIGSAFALHKFLRRDRIHKKEEQAGGIVNECGKSYVAPYKEKSKEECLKWMEEHGLSSGKVKGWNNDMVAEYMITFGGDPDLLPGLIKHRMPDWAWR